MRNNIVLAGLCGLAFLWPVTRAAALTVQNQDSKSYYLKIGENEKPLPIGASASLEVSCEGGCRVRLVDVKSGKAIDMIEVPASGAKGRLNIRQEGLSE